MTTRDTCHLMQWHGTVSIQGDKRMPSLTQLVRAGESHEKKKSNLMVGSSQFGLFVKILAFPFSSHENTILSNYLDDSNLRLNQNDLGPFKMNEVHFRCMDFWSINCSLARDNNITKVWIIMLPNTTYFIIFWRSAPEKPGVPRARILGSTSADSYQQKKKMAGDN